MKKKLSYREKLIELAYIYDVKEIKEYVKSRKNLTSGQLELILKKNKIIIPKDYKSNFIKDTFVKPISKVKSNLIEFKENQIKAKNRMRCSRALHQQDWFSHLLEDDPIPSGPSTVYVQPMSPVLSSHVHGLG